MGHAIEPAIKPLGFNWKIGIGLITSLAARETIVGTLGEIYGMDPESHNDGPAEGPAARPDAGRGDSPDGVLRLRHAVHLDHRGGAARDGRLEWPLLQFAYMGVLAYAGAFLAFHLIG